MLCQARQVEPRADLADAASTHWGWEIEVVHLDDLSLGKPIDEQAGQRTFARRARAVDANEETRPSCCLPRYRLGELIDIQLVSFFHFIL